MYYNRFRYYHPKDGSYINQVPIGLQGGINLYDYPRDPVQYVDPFALTKCPNQDPKIVDLKPEEIRFSQSSVNGAMDLTNSMKTKGWAGEPIDVVRMKDGGLTTIANTRVLAASRARINVKARIHDGSSPLPQEFIERFTTKKGIPSTCEDAIKLRIGKQNAGYRNLYPNGSTIIGNIN